jgi:hypothetical protein
MSSKSPGPSLRRKRFIFGVLTLGCLLVDLVVLAALLEGVRWLVTSASPFTLAGAAAAAILIARMFLFMQAGKRSVREDLPHVAART